MRLFRPPWIATPVAGPVIVGVPAVSFSSSWLPERVIVWGLLLDGSRSKLVSPFPADLRAARAMASGRSARPPPGRAQLLVGIHHQIGDDRSGIGQGDGGNR